MKSFEKSAEMMETQRNLNAEEPRGMIAMENRRGWNDWLKENKKEILIGATICIVAVAGYLAYKHRDLIKAGYDVLKKNLKQPIKFAKQPTSKFVITPATKATKPAAQIVMKVTPEPMREVVNIVPPQPIQEVAAIVPSDSASIPYMVREHIRTLPNGYHASPEKIAEAAKKNIILLDGQTLVNSYPKGGIVA